jgi:hypothetical protein
VFNGVFESPNHQFKLEVADTGISLKGPTSKINLTNGGIEVQSLGLDGVKVRTGGGALGRAGNREPPGAGGRPDQRRPGAAERRLPVARVGDLVTGSPVGQIVTGSSTVCAG